VFHVKQVDVQSPRGEKAMEEDLVLKSFRHMLYVSLSMLVKFGRPTNAPQEDWDFALAALLAMAED